MCNCKRNDCTVSLSTVALKNALAHRVALRNWAIGHRVTEVGYFNKSVQF